MIWPFTMGSGVPQWPAVNVSRKGGYAAVATSLVGKLLRSTGDAPTETLDQRSAPEPIGQTLAHPGAHQCVSGVAREDGGRSVDGQCADLVAVWWSSEVATGND